VASPLVIRPLPPSRFRPLAPYCPLSWHLTAENSSPGCHPTAPPPLAGTLLLPPLWLALYCSPRLAGTLLLPPLKLAPYCSPPSGWHPTAPPPLAGTLLLPPLWMAPYCYPPAGTLLLTFQAGIASARWLRSPFSPPPIVRPVLGYA